ncbi:MAG: DJ-1/PfpI family protein [Lachnospiraceae bacterium]|nr:DJ-1/PfpI family protein [Lachnospiraceae bacterium]
MADVLIFLAEGHEEVEMLTVVDMVRRAKIEIDMVSITGKKEVTSSHGVTIVADKTFEELTDDDFSAAKALVLPGGMPGTLNLKAYKPLTDKVVDFNNQGKVIAAVCAAPTVFGGLGLLEGKKATCYQGMEEGLVGALTSEDRVVVDGNIITSRGMGTCIEFAGAIITALDSADTAERIKNAIHFY